MALNINEIRGQLALGGQRPALFQVLLNNPVNPAGDSKTPFMIRAAQIPASTLGMIEIPYFGRKIKIAGDRTIEDWSVTVYNDTDFKLRNAFERWSNGINNMTDNEGLTNPADYQVDAFVDQLDRNGATIKSYTLRGVFPTTIAPIELTFDEATAIEEFAVTFAYQYFETNTTT